jgi:hypothetical protein
VERDLLKEETERLILRAAIDLAMAMGIDMDGTLDLSRHLAREAIKCADERVKVLDERAL